MSKLEKIINLKEVIGGIICDKSGTLLEHANTPDAESVAAVTGYYVNLIIQCGESLGFDVLSRINLTGKDLSCIVFLENNFVQSIYLDPSSSQTEFEKKIHAMKRNSSLNDLVGIK